MGARKGRFGSTAIAIATFLLLVVAIPANARPRTTTNTSPSIVTALHHGDSITMASGFSEYLYVGGSSANAYMSQSTFGHTASGSCRPPKPTETPLGVSSSSQASFSTNGVEAGIVGVAVSGYKVKRFPDDNGYEWSCGYLDQPQSIGATEEIATKHGALFLILVGTEGVNRLTFSIEGNNPSPCNPTGGVKVLRNATYSKGPNNDNGAAASVAVLSVQLPPGSDCEISSGGTTVPNGSSYGAYSEPFMLIPLVGAGRDQ